VQSCGVTGGGVDEGDGLGDGLGLVLGDGLGLGELLVDSAGLGSLDGLGVVLALALGVVLALGEELALADGEELALADGVALAVALADGLAPRAAAEPRAVAVMAEADVASVPALAFFAAAFFRVVIVGRCAHTFVALARLAVESASALAAVAPMEPADSTSKPAMMPKMPVRVRPSVVAFRPNVIAVAVPPLRRPLQWWRRSAPWSIALGMSRLTHPFCNHSTPSAARETMELGERLSHD
jgi:hypothetical protein